MKFLKLLLLFVIILSVNLGWAQTVAEWSTSMGSFQIMMREDLVPITVGNFVDLTNSNFYDDLIFHRVIDDFMIQDGCPNGNGYGGPGYTIPDEFHEDILFNSEGVIGMANTGQPNSAGSQYFITLEATTWLNWGYAAFGNVIEGMDVVQAIGDVPTTGPNGNPANKPLDDVNIDSIRIVTPQIENVIPEEDTLYVDGEETISFFVLSNDENLEYFWYINDDLQSATGFAFNYTFGTNGEFEVKSIVSNGAFEYPTTWFVTVTGTEANHVVSNHDFSLYQNTPNPFNPETNIKFTLEQGNNVSLIIYNLKGQFIRNLVSEHLEAGLHSIIWDGKDDNGKSIGSGIYYYKMDTENYSEVKRAILLK